MANPDRSQEVFDKAWDAYARGLKETILKEAKRHTEGRGLSEPEAYRALDQYFRQIPPLNRPRSDRFGAWANENLFLLVAIAMTALFGLIGWRLAESTNPESVAQSKTFIDVAKIFAGAIVGSAAGSGIARRRSGGS